MPDSEIYHCRMPKRGIGTLVVIVLVGVIIIVSAGAYFLAVNTATAHNVSSTLSTSSSISKTSSSGQATTSASQTKVTIVEGAVVSGAHLSSQEIHFSPQTIAVEVGVNNTIVWVNQDTTPHIVTSNTNAFNSGSISPRANFTMTFTAPGTYQYHCSIHPFMTGTVIALN
ncbi:MAG: cupredoxin domain-containing protein [Nitrososphaerota archaeon]|jgi:plastocyanin|nr:cupredoxin domain-containing protein [Nitrososphaerota archaeon]